MTLAFCALCISGKLFFLQGPGSPGSQGLDPLVAAPSGPGSLPQCGRWRESAGTAHQSFMVPTRVADDGDPHRLTAATIHTAPASRVMENRAVQMAYFPSHPSLPGTGIPLHGPRIRIQTDRSGTSPLGPPPAQVKYHL